MRTALLTALIICIFALAGCGSKEMDDPEIEQAAEAVEAQEAADTGNAPAEEPAAEPEKPQIRLTGAITLKDGSKYAIREFPRFGKYYIYIAGTFNGRASTVISLTRTDDLQNWGRFEFKDARTMRITTRKDEKLIFTKSTIYFGCQGSKFCFHVYNPDTLDTEMMEFDRNNVAEITINDPNGKE